MGTIIERQKNGVNFFLVAKKMGLPLKKWDTTM